MISLNMKKKSDPTELIKKAEKALAKKAKNHPKFSAGDTVQVHVRVKEGEKTRIQIFEGIVISKRRTGVTASFMVRKISFGIGIERVFPLLSPVVEKIVIVTRGDVRRAKLLYLRKLKGRKARVKSHLAYGRDGEGVDSKPKPESSSVNAPENTEAEKKAAEA